MNKKVIKSLSTLFISNLLIFSMNTPVYADFEYQRMSKSDASNLINSMNKKYKIPKAVLALRCDCLDGQELAAYIAFLAGKITYKEIEEGYLITQVFKDEVKDTTNKMVYLFSRKQNVLSFIPPSYSGTEIKRLVYNGREVSRSEITDYTLSFKLKVSDQYHCGLQRNNLESGNRNLGENSVSGSVVQKTLTFDNGSKYVGSLKNGKMDGKGVWTDNTGTKYVGDFKDDKIEGRGTITVSNGNKYEGQWKDNMMNGTGTFTWANGDTKSTIYLANVNGGSQTELVKNVYNVSTFEFSPDDKKLLFTDSGNGDVNNLDIYSIDIDSEKKTNITSTDTISEQFPSYSLDGKKIGFTASGTDVKSGLYIMSSEGSDRKLVTDDNSIKYPFFIAN